MSITKFFVKNHCSYYLSLVREVDFKRTIKWSLKLNMNILKINIKNHTTNLLNLIYGIIFQ